MILNDEQRKKVLDNIPLTLGRMFGGKEDGLWIHTWLALSLG